MRLTAGLAIAAAVVTVGCTGITETQGMIESGERWGVRIGMPPDKARKAVESQGFTFIETRTDGQCLKTRLKPGDVADLYWMQKWRRGTACVVYRDGAVVRLEWFASMFLP